MKPRESSVLAESAPYGQHDSQVISRRDWCHGQARRFLQRLDPEAKAFTFQTFDDTSAKRRELARIMHGDFDRVADALDDLQQARAGVFVTVAETDGKGRQAHNIHRVRAVFVDLDGAPLAPILEAGLAPHIICESSPGKYHAYWLCDDCPLDQFDPVQRALARRFGGDQSVHDLPRVMRVPGFRHYKGEAQTSKMLDDIGTNAPPYALAEIVRALGLDLNAPEPVASTRPNGDGGMIVPGNRHGHLFAIGRRIAKGGLSRDAVRAALAAENQSRCEPPLPDPDIDTLAVRAFTAKDAQGWQRNPPRDEGGERPKTEDHEWPPALDLEVLAEREPQAPQSIMEGIPVGYATLLAGHGGVGKSAIALFLAVCIAAGAPFFGLKIARRRVFFLSCEDRESVLHWRLSRICSYLGVDLASLRGWLEIVDLVGADAILWDRDPRTGNTITPAYTRLQERMSAHQTEVLILDGISDSFAGNENARAEVKRFVNGLVALIPPDTGAVLLVGHVSKPGSTAGADGQGYSGSTGWHNSVRARWYLYPETIQNEDGGRAERTGKLIFELQKSNHGEVGTQIEFEWDAEAHLFVGRAKGGLTEFDRRHRDRTEQKGILGALKACAACTPPIIVPTAMQGPRTAFHVLSQRPEFPDTLRAGNPAKRRFWRQIESLRQIHAIAEVEYRRTDRHAAARLTITPEGVRECGE